MSDPGDPKTVRGGTSHVLPDPSHVISLLPRAHCTTPRNSHPIISHLLTSGVTVCNISYAPLPLLRARSSGLTESEVNDG